MPSPTTIHFFLIDYVENMKEATPIAKVPNKGAGTTKRKELHGSVNIRVLSGTWGDNNLDHAVFYAYKMEFSCNIADEKYSSFLLLLEKKLDEDVGNFQVQLYLLSKSVKASVFMCGEIHLDAQQVATAKCFQQLMFNGLFGKLFFKPSGGGRKFLFQTDKCLWDPSNMYLLLPLELVEPLRINWTELESCVSAVEFLKINAWLNIPGESCENSTIDMNDSVSMEINQDTFHLANRSASVDSLKGVVVVAIHTGRVYSILDAVSGTSSRSPFEGDAETSYSSYADYYNKKYGIVLKHPEQSLLLLKQSHCSHNLLVDFRSEEAGNKTNVQKPRQYAYIPPELLVVTDIRADVMKSIYLLPSMMHRIESLMLASQLREEIAGKAGNLNVSIWLILEALTTLRCNESFSMERLELLGDSVLKYAVTCHFFLKYPNKDEGQLSSSRQMVICNSALHRFGTNRNLQGYIRDCAFDPRRWTAPGQRSIWPCPCDHGVDAMEVPLNEKFFTEDIKITIGKSCDKGHRWIGSKTISDCLEALIGAYYVGGGFSAALSLMKWFDIEAEVDPAWIENAIKSASLHSYAPKMDDIEILESKLDCKFSVKGLLLEAITHATKPEQGVGFSYERLEFLGDSVLDVLVTWYLFQTHKNIDPGELTDLRSASVTNDNFAVVAVRRNLHSHLQHDSPIVEKKISEFVECVSGMSSNVLTPDTKGPKVLGDLVESIAGALLIDSNLDLDKVWKIFEPILSPIVTPDKLELTPARELVELCDSLGYYVKEQYSVKGDTVHAKLELRLKDVVLDGHGSGQSRKAAKGMAALQLLKKLEGKGMRRKNDSCSADGSSNCNGSSSIIFQTQSETPELKAYKKRKLQPDVNAGVDCSNNLEIPVVPPIDMKKGGPRVSLFALCKKLKLPMPTFETVEQKSRTPFQFGDITGFNSYESEISLTLPDFSVIKLTGEARPDKKSSFDSAALRMLYELQRLGKIIIGE